MIDSLMLGVYDSSQVTKGTISEQDIGSLVNATADKLVSLVFWYKDSNPAPIYTLDARHTPLDSATLLSSPSSSTSAAKFASRLSSAPMERVREIGLLNFRLLQKAKHYRSVAAPKSMAQVSVLPGSELFHTEEQNSANNSSKVPSKRHPKTQAPATTTMAQQLEQTWPIVQLTLNDVTARLSSAAYKCRVDFRRARTLTRQVRLLVQGK